MKAYVRLTALLVAAIIVLFSLCACTVKPDPNPVIMTVDDFELTKFDFAMSYTNNEYYYNYMYGAISAEEYFNRVMNDVTKFAVSVNQARKLGITLTEDEEANLNDELEKQYDYVYEQYRKRVPDSITGDEAVKTEIERLYALDMGYTLDDYRTYYYNTIYNNAIARKLYDQVVEGVTPDEEQVRTYIMSKVIEQSRSAFSSFADNYNNFLAGEGNIPFYVPEACFTVNRLYFAFDKKEVNGETVYDDAMANLRADDIDIMLERGISSELFMELISARSEDENMKDATYFDWGYLIHKSLESEYEPGFVYAALKMTNSGHKPLEDDVPDIEIDVFTTTDNKKVIKFRNENGINYLIRNRTFLKGDMAYEKGDELWNLAYDGAYKIECDKVYNKIYENWYGEAKITYYYDRFKDEYINDFTGFPNLGWNNSNPESKASL